MPKKAFKKKKQYQAMCREQVKNGLMNGQDGLWRPASQLNQAHRRMFEDCKAGYKF